MRAETVEEMTRQGPSTYGYYRQPDGWITVAVVTPLEELKYRREGWEPLSQYGSFDMASPYAAHHPLEALFVQGGAKELTVRQIIETGMHVWPPKLPNCRRPLNQYHKAHDKGCLAGAQEVHFPQLTTPPPILSCRLECGRLFPTELARSRHERVIHQQEAATLSQGKVIAESIAKGLRGVAPRAEAEEVQPAPGEPSAETSPLPYMCGLCSESFNSHIQLARHVKAEHKVAESGGVKQPALSP